MLVVYHWRGNKVIHIILSYTNQTRQLLRVLEWYQRTIYASMSVIPNILFISLTSELRLLHCAK